MTKRKITSSDQLDRLTDSLIEDILAMSNEEIISEGEEQFDDPKTEVERLHGVIDNALLQASKAKLAEAQAAVAVHKHEKGLGKIVTLSSAQKRAVIDLFAAQDPELQEKLTMAARNGKGMQTENDVDGMFEDLIELGFIDEQGNPR